MLLVPPIGRSWSIATIFALLILTTLLLGRQGLKVDEQEGQEEQQPSRDNKGGLAEKPSSTWPWLWNSPNDDEDDIIGADIDQLEGEKDADEKTKPSSDPQPFNLCRSSYQKSIPIANATINPQNISLIVFGDSVDRYMIADWCRRSKTRYACGALGSAGPEKCDVFDQFVNSTVPRALAGEFAFVFCRDVANDVAVVLVHNRFATDPNIASYCRSSAALLAGQGINATLNFPSPEEGWRKLLLPFLQKSALLLGRPADSVMIQSLYWDFLKFKGCNFDTFRLLHANGSSSDDARSEWISQHTRNATTLMRSIVSLAINDAGLPLKWAGWRTSNLVIDLGTNDTNKWRWPRVNELITTANGALTKAARETLGLDVFFIAGENGEKGEPPLRDVAHPNPAAAAQLMQDMLLQIGECTSKPGMATAGANNEDPDKARLLEAEDDEED